MAAQAGELITHFTIAVQSEGAIGAVELAKAIVPYPTNTEAIKYCCNQYNIQVRITRHAVKHDIFRKGVNALLVDAVVEHCKPILRAYRCASLR